MCLTEIADNGANGLKLSSCTHAAYIQTLTKCTVVKVVL